MQELLGYNCLKTWVTIVYLNVWTNLPFILDIIFWWIWRLLLLLQKLSFKLVHRVEQM